MTTYNGQLQGPRTVTETKMIRKFIKSRKLIPEILAYEVGRFSIGDKDYKKIHEDDHVAIMHNGVIFLRIFDDETSSIEIRNVQFIKEFLGL